MDQPIPNSTCPACGGPVTYDGNYFCLDRQDCRWALNHPTPAYLVQWYALAYTNLMVSRGKTPDPQVVTSILAEPDLCVTRLDPRITRITSRRSTMAKTPSGLPDVKDYARTNPPWASIQVGRIPVVRWHSTRGGAKVSARNGATGSGYDFDTHERGPEPVTASHAIARLQPDGSLLVTEAWLEGTVL